MVREDVSRAACCPANSPLPSLPPLSSPRHSLPGAKFPKDCLHLCLPGPTHPFLAQAMLRVLESFGLDNDYDGGDDAAAPTPAPQRGRSAQARVCVAPGAYAAAESEGEGGEGEGGAEVVKCPPR